MDKIFTNICDKKTLPHNRYRTSNLLQRMAKISLKNRLTTKSNELMVDLFKGHASSPYSDMMPMEE